MSKAEAILRMLDGDRITHELFSSNEWMKMENGKVITEDGCIHNPIQFWSYRTGRVWGGGYSIFEGN